VITVGPHQTPSVGRILSLPITRLLLPGLPASLLKARREHDKSRPVQSSTTVNEKASGTRRRTKCRRPTQPSRHVATFAIAGRHRPDGRLTPVAVTAFWWLLRCRFGSAGSCLQLARSWLAPRASGWLDPAADPDRGRSAEMRASEANGRATLTDTAWYCSGKSAGPALRGGTHARVAVIGVSQCGLIFGVS
jgi:hypothetical protein